jgi:hypothetical protein
MANVRRFTIIAKTGNKNTKKLCKFNSSTVVEDRAASEIINYRANKCKEEENID